jgi:hypothetical protein
MKAYKKLLLSGLALISLALWLNSERTKIKTQVKKSTPFSLNAIFAEVPYCPDWEGRALKAEEERVAIQALSQDYRYLGSGGQCYSFVSADQKYVIKFFKQKAFAIPEWIHRFPLPLLVEWLKEKKRLKKERLRNKVFTAFKLSIDCLPQETGMLYIHLNPTSHLKKKLRFYNSSGACQLLDLDRLEFAVQKKAELAFHRIDALMQAKDIEGAKQAIDKLLELHLSLSKKGFRNRDLNFRSNCGFIGLEAIVIDVGRIVYSQDIKQLKNFRKDLLKSTPHFRKYLTLNHPDLLPYFEDAIAKIVASDHNRPLVQGVY